MPLAVYHAFGHVKKAAALANGAAGRLPAWQASVIGYDKAAEIAHRADRCGSTSREAALSLGYISAEEFDRVTDPASMVGDTRAGQP